jgi:hypothetical protein
MIIWVFEVQLKVNTHNPKHFTVSYFAKLEELDASPIKVTPTRDRFA